jgi:Fur family ferric uptake transcriptional regulator
MTGASGQTEARRHIWREFREARGLKHSMAREAVVDAFLDQDGHITLARLTALAQRRVASVGFATVHRTMRLLEQAGLAERHDFTGAMACYEPTGGSSHHDHMICTRCGQILEFESEEIERLQERIALSLGFRVCMHRHELYGICRDCRLDRPTGDAVDSGRSPNDVS